MTRYEFAILRYVHDLVGGEFANVGVVLCDLDGRRVIVRLTEQSERLKAFFGTIDVAKYRGLAKYTTDALTRAAGGLGTADDQSLPKGFLTSLVRATSINSESAIQISDVGSGITESADARFEELFVEFVDAFSQASMRSATRRPTLRPETSLPEPNAPRFRSRRIADSLSYEKREIGGAIGGRWMPTGIDG